MRPVGALLFGLLADRYGRRIPLMANVNLFSITNSCAAFSPTSSVHHSARAVWHRHGRRNGSWRVLAMEARPVRGGSLSGILQSGYRLASLGRDSREGFSPARWGWRPMLLIGALPHYLRLHSHESAGIRSMEATPRCEHGAGFAHRCGRMEALFAYLSC